jgi:hypothetical protein
MQCIICGRFADGSAHTRGGNSPDMLIQVHVSFVCWTCKHRMLGLDCFNVMFVLPVSDRQNLLQHTHTHTHTHARASACTDAITHQCTCTCGGCLECSLLLTLPLRVSEAELPVEALRPSALRSSALNDCFGELTQLPLLVLPGASNCPAMQTHLVLSCNPNR